MGLSIRTLVVAALVVCSFNAGAEANEGPVYQRHRSSAAYGYATGSGVPRYFPGYPIPGYPVVGYYQQPYSGYWFQRPYPYHLDYRRVRSRMPTPACPCTENLVPTPAAETNE